MTTRCPPPVRRNARSEARATWMVPSTFVETASASTSDGTSSKRP